MRRLLAALLLFMALTTGTAHAAAWTVHASVTPAAMAYDTLAALTVTTARVDDMDSGPNLLVRAVSTFLLLGGLLLCLWLPFSWVLTCCWIITHWVSLGAAFSAG
jgi:hypothetical protein